MAEPVTIGDQTFVKTNEGWIDKKTKSQAPEDLFSLLNMLSVESSGDYKRLRVRVDKTKPPITITNQEYIFDLNQGKWLNKKTKDPVNDALQKIINGVLAKIEAEKSAMASSIAESMGILGQVSRSTVKGATNVGKLPKINSPVVSVLEKLTAKETLIKANLIDAAPIPNIKGIDAEAVELENNKSNASSTAAARSVGKTTSGTGKLPKINSPIIKMIEKLATIDGYLKQRLDNQKLAASQLAIVAKEQAIETKPVDATPVPDMKDVDAAVESENKKSNAALIAVAVGAAGLIASQFDPIKEAFSSIIDFSKGVYEYITNFAGIMNSGLEKVNSFGSEKKPTIKPIAGASSSSTPPKSVPTSPTGFSVVPESNFSAADFIDKSDAPSSTVNTAPAQSEIVVTAPRKSSYSKPVAITSPPPALSSSSSLIERTAASTPTTRSAPTTKASANAAPVSQYTSPKNNFVMKKPQQSSTTSEKLANSGFSVVPKTGLTAADFKKQTKTQSDATKVSNIKNVVPVNHPDTGEGYGIAGANDQSGRPIAFSKEGAEAFSRMMAESGGVVKPSDITSSKRSIAKNASLPNAATDSLHLSGIAMDIHGKSKSWIKANGSKYGWVENAYSGSHGGHFEFKGPGMAPSGSDSMLATAGKTIYALGTGAMEAIGNILRAGVGDRPSVSVSSQLSGFNDTVAGNINSAAKERNASIAEARTLESSASTPADPININTNKSSPVVQNVPTSSDYAGVEHYLTRMGFPKIHYTQTSRGATLR